MNNTTDIAYTRSQTLGRTQQLPVGLSVEYNALTETLEITWSGNAGGNNLCEGYSYLMEQVQAHRPTKWLLDLQHCSAISRRDQRWVFQHVFPEVLRQVGDDVFVAVLLPLDLYYGLIAGLQGDELMNGESFMIIQHFLFQQEAMRWLHEMEAMKGSGDKHL